MRKDELMLYTDYLTRLAQSKCRTQADAEDLVSETILAALCFQSCGGIIEYPKTWLANTLMHKHNDTLRRRYRAPAVVNYDTQYDIAGEDSFYEFEASDEAAEVRRELSYLAHINREVIIRYYLSGESVGAIASTLGIPSGTVKSRLDNGRKQMKKGLEQMDNQTNHIPGHLNISWGGSDGAKNEPMSLVENDLIAQNLLILAYEKLLTVTELARAIGIPTVYIEPIIDRLVNGELMVRTDSGRVNTDFIIYKPEDSLTRFEGQLVFVRAHFDTFRSVMSEIIEQLHALDYYAILNPRQTKKLERYAIMQALQGFESYGGKTVYGTPQWNHPNRRDGGSWIAVAWAYPAGYNYDKINELQEYIFSGHRTSGGACDYQGAKFLRLCEYDTLALRQSAPLQHMRL